MRHDRRQQTDSPKAAQSRRGLALLVVLVAVGISSAIGMGLIQLALMHKRQTEQVRFAAQSRWLAEAGLEHAVTLLRKDPNSKGTTWKVPAEELASPHSAIVTIEISGVETRPERRLVTVTAEFPVESPRKTKTQWKRFVDR